MTSLIARESIRALWQIEADAHTRSTMNELRPNTARPNAIARTRKAQGFVFAAAQPKH